MEKALKMNIARSGMPLLRKARKNTQVQEAKMENGYYIIQGKKLR